MLSRIVNLTVAGMLMISSVAANGSPMVIRVAELSLRKSVVTSVMPTFPQDAIRRRVSGVAVAQILFDADGKVIRSKILEAPDASTGDAVIAAVKQWKIHPQTVNSEPVQIRGKLTFYFVIDRSGVGRVTNPKQVS